MHIVLDLVPLDVDPRPMGAEHGICRVLHIALGVIAQLRDHRPRLRAGLVAVASQAQPPPPPGVGHQFLHIAVHGRHRGGAPQQHQLPRLLRRVKFSVHGPHIADGPADLFLGHRHLKAVPGLQQQALRLHQPLAHRTVGGLAEVPALGVLVMGLSGGQTDLHIRDGRAGEHPQMGLFL